MKIFYENTINSKAAAHVVSIYEENYNEEDFIPIEPGDYIEPKTILEFKDEKIYIINCKLFTFNMNLNELLSINIFVDRNYAEFYNEEHSNLYTNVNYVTNSDIISCMVYKYLFDKTSIYSCPAYIRWLHRDINDIDKKYCKYYDHLTNISYKLNFDPVKGIWNELSTDKDVIYFLDIYECKVPLTFEDEKVKKKSLMDKLKFRIKKMFKMYNV